MGVNSTLRPSKSEYRLPAGSSSSLKSDTSVTKPSSSKATKGASILPKAKIRTKAQLAVVEDEPMEEDDAVAATSSSSSPEDDADEGEEEVDADEELEEEDDVASQKSVHAFDQHLRRT